MTTKKVNGALFEKAKEEKDSNKQNLFRRADKAITYSDPQILSSARERKTDAPTVCTSSLPEFVDLAVNVKCLHIHAHIERIYADKY